MNQKARIMQKAIQSITIGCLLTGASIVFASVTAEAAEAKAADDWQFGAEVYLWGADINGEQPNGAPIELPFNDIVDDLEWGFMGAFAARKNRWEFVIDGIYLDIEDSETISIPDDPNPPVDGNAKVELKGKIGTTMAVYRLVESKRYSFDVGAGARYLDLEVDLSVTPDGGPESSGDDSFHNWDGIAVARGLYDLNEKWYLAGYGDVGTGDSNITWQLQGSVGYRFNSWDIKAGYRYLKWEFDTGSNDLLKELDVKGPYAGALFRF